MKLIPITLVTGYLGSGKTTLLRRIANQNKPNFQIAVLMNEFGDIAIDSKVISGKNIKMIELAGGCVCCSLAGEFEYAVDELLKTVRPDWIIIETTGVAEPSALAYDIIENIKGVRLEGLVTLVDADAMIRFPNLGHTGREQIELADLVLINKADLVDKNQMKEVHKIVKELNKAAEIRECINAEVDVPLIRKIKRVQRKITALTKHDAEESEFVYDTDKLLDYTKFVKFINNLPEQVYRFKGFVRTEKGDFLINYVAGRNTLEPFACTKTQLVFIGEKVEEVSQSIRETLETIKTRERL